MALSLGGRSMGSSGGNSEHFLRQLTSSDGSGAPHQLEEWECGSGGRRGSRRWPRKKALSLFPSVVYSFDGCFLLPAHTATCTRTAPTTALSGGRSMGSSEGNSEHFLRQLSSSDGSGAPHQLEEWECGGGGRRGSRRWPRKKARTRSHRGGGFCSRTREEAAAGRKRVMVLVDQSSGAKHAMMWALTHVANKGDFLTLLHVLPQGSDRGRGEDSARPASLRIIVMLSHPSPPKVDGARHLSSTLSHTAERLLSCILLHPLKYCQAPRNP